jgi:hypothetical protein
MGAAISTDEAVRPPAGPTRPALPLLPFISTVLVVQVMDRLISARITLGPLVDDPGQRDAIRLGEDVGDIVFVAVALVVAIAALVRVRPRWMNALVIGYLSVATANLALNVGTLVATAELLQGQRLALLWDVGLVYASTVLVFSLWYRLLDTELTEGAFDWPVDPAHPDRRPGWIDYVFLSFNTNATFGPTTEVVHARSAKVVMMGQTVISLLVLVVLVARIAGLGS